MAKETDPRMHSAEHILTGTLVRMFGCGRPFTTHLERKKSKADYAFSRALTTGEVAEIERQVNEVIASDARVREDMIPRSEADRLYDLRRLPEETGETIRIIRIGDYDACACSGMHVTSTAEIGRFRVVSTTFEDGALRVRFKLEEPGDRSGG
jgi:misacylated tRNA(Ala) deacylase